MQFRNCEMLQAHSSGTRCGKAFPGRKFQQKNLSPAFAPPAYCADLASLIDGQSRDR